MAWNQAKLLSIFAIFVSQTASAPDVFGEYFDEDVKAVEVDQGTAIKACLSQPGPLIVTINTATRTCLGGDNDFDWNDFAQMNQGADSNNNGISNAMEAKELCFYREMKWLEGTTVQKGAILEDFDSIEDDDIKSTFVNDVNKCVAWSGSFKSRKRRSIEESGQFSMINLLRSKRQAMGRRPAGAGAPRPGGPRPGMAGGAQRPGMGQGGPRPGGPRPAIGGQKAPVGGPAARKSAVRRQPKAKVPAKQGIPKGKAKGPSPKQPKQPIDAMRSNENPAYNTLWCVDLAVQKALKTCVEDILEDF